MTFEIRTLADDELITDPGFYNISLDRHHSQPCDGVSVTSGVLRRIETHGPSKTWASHHLNPDCVERKDTDALRLGRAMACFVEGGLEEFERHWMALADDKPNRPTKAQMVALREGRESAAARKSIAYWADVDRDPREKVSDKEFLLIAQMGAALANDPAACAILGGMPEITMATFDEPSQLWFLARPDNVHFDGTQADYKKINTAGRPFNHHICDRSIEKFGYDQQLGFACEVFEALTGEWVPEAGLVFQEDEAPFDVIIRPMPEEDLRIGQFLNRRSAMRFRECLDANHWPKPGDDIGAFMRSTKSRERLLEEMNVAGEAP